MQCVKRGHVIEVGYGWNIEQAYVNRMGDEVKCVAGGNNVVTLNREKITEGLNHFPASNYVNVAYILQL